MTRIFRYLAVFALIGGGLTAAVSGVLAFESQVIGVDISVSNSLGTPAPFSGILAHGSEDIVFPEEFLQDSVTVGLSDDFKNT